MIILTNDGQLIILITPVWRTTRTGDCSSFNLTIKMIINHDNPDNHNQNNNNPHYHNQNNNNPDNHNQNNNDNRHQFGERPEHASAAVWRRLDAQH